MSPDAPSPAQPGGATQPTAIGERRPPAYVVLHPDDAAALGDTAGDGVRDPASGARFAVAVDAGAMVGHVYYGSGLPGAWPVPPAKPVHLEHDPDYVPPTPPDGVIARG